MDKEQIEGTIRNGNAMTEIATGLKPDERQNQISKDMLEGKITLKEALAKSYESITGEKIDPERLS